MASLDELLDSAEENIDRAKDEGGHSPAMENVFDSIDNLIDAMRLFVAMVLDGRP